MIILSNNELSFEISIPYIKLVFKNKKARKPKKLAKSTLAQRKKHNTQRSNFLHAR